MDKIKEQRIVELCSDADALHGRADRSRLWAYGYAGIAELAGCEVEHVRQAASRGAFDPRDLLDVARWVQERRNRSPVVVAPPICGGDLHVRSVSGMALYTEKASGERVYVHRCEKCMGYSERPAVGGTCQRPLAPV